jgi:hypothetical protein
LQPEHVKKAKERGYLEQRGVLRTNCVDCLDRTNVGQFAVGMRFLGLSLKAAGLSDNQAIEPSSRVLLTLMDMYSQMGDRIALQYGGSEAHKKVSSGPAGHQLSSISKQGELYTSITRYMSNAFTDVFKQDAMNVFLGIRYIYVCLIIFYSFLIMRAYYILFP